MPQELTPELKKRLQSKGWRMINLYWITTKDQQQVKFFPNKAQKHFFLNRTKRNIVLKSRQLGFTTFACIDMFDDAMFNPNFSGLLIAQDDVSMQEIFDKTHFAWKHFPYAPLFELDTQRSNQLKVGFLDGKDGQSKSYSNIIVKQSGRSGTFHSVHISEFGKICSKYPHKVKEILTGTFPSVPIDGKITIESTAEGETGKFHEMFWDAYNRPKGSIARPTDFKAFFYNWQWDTAEIAKIQQPDAQIPKEFLDYQKQHNEKAKKDHTGILQPISDIELTYYFYKWLDKKDWNLHKQEYPTTPEEAFVSSGVKFFDQSKVENLKRYIHEPRTMNDWSFYQPYKPGHVYAAAADPSEGIGRDACAAVIMDFTPLQPEVVATYSNPNTPPDLFANELLDGCKLYNFPLLAVERNNHGHATITALKHIYPEHQLYTEVKEGYEDDRETTRIGWNTTLTTKPKMMYDLRTAINEELIKVPSKQLIEEIRTYDARKLSDNRYDEEATRHWDLLTAFAICFQMKTNLHHSTQRVITTSHRSTTSSDRFSAI